MPRSADNNPTRNPADAGSSLDHGVDSASIGLDQVLRALSRDLKKAQASAEADPVGLYIDEAEVELSFTVEKGKKGGGGVNFRVFGVGAGGDASLSSSDATVHRIKIVLRPDGSNRIPLALEGFKLDEAGQAAKSTKRRPVAR